MTSGTGTFTLTPEQDEVAEGDEGITIAGTSALPVTGTELVLTDDDPASTGVALSVSPERVGEGAGAADVVVTATLDGSASPTSTEVTVSVGAPGDGAAAGTDYQAVSDLTVTVPAGRTSGTGTFTLTPEQDQVAEGDEGITIAGTSALPVTGTELTLTDDDPASTGVTLSVVPESVAEDDGATAVVLTATLDGLASATATEVTVSVGAPGDGAAAGTDYQAVSDFTVTVPAGMTSGTETFTLPPTDDGLAEGDEGITIAGTSALPVTGTELVLTDDDPASTGVALSVSPERVGEGAGATDVVLTATLDGSASPTATEVTVSVGAVGDGATAGTDYQAVAAFTVTVPAGRTSGTGTFTLTPEQDEVAEGDETVSVTGTAPGLAVTGTELVLTDDDTASTAVTLSVAPESAAEDDGATTVSVTATLDGSASPTATEVTVSVGAVGDGATAGTDYQAVAAFTVTVPAGRTSGTGTFTLTPTDDGLGEGDEEITVEGSATGLAVTGTELTLTDDDTVSTGVTLSVALESVGENAGATAVSVTATLDGSASPTATEVAVSVGAVGDGATAGTDYQTVSNLSVTIPAGDTSGTGTFTLTPTDDGLAEGDEGITIGGTSALPVTGTELTLTDDDPASTVVTLSVVPESVAEDAGATAVSVTATLDGAASPTATEVTVSVGAVGDGAAAGTDYQAVSNFSLTVPAGMTSGTETFTLTPEQDEVAEGDETVSVTGTATGLAVTGTELVLTDDDTASTGVTLSVVPESVGEDAGATAVVVTATLDGSASPTATAVTVSVGAPGDGAATGTDYQAVSNFSVTIPAGDTSGTGTFTLTPERTMGSRRGTRGSRSGERRLFR